MARTTLPPTPASSTDIHGQDGTKQLSALQMAFELPEPALRNPSRSHATASFSPVSPVSTSSSKAPYPIQPSEAVKSRRRSSAAAAVREHGSKSNHNDTFALPPPPTRSRKIIQMKPKTLQDQASGPEIVPAPSTTKSTSGKSAGKRTAAAAPFAIETEPSSSSKRKQPSATSAAGRRIARKTAHSLIERRRRSKMNEEFGVLKDMIPACTGEMHKLAILQASIEYVRYLHDCIEKLQARDPQTPTGRDDTTASSFQPPPYKAVEEEEEDEEERSPDVEMADSDSVSSSTYTTHPSSSTTFSHRHQPDATIHRHGSDASINSIEHHRHFSHSGSATTSPAVPPGWGAVGYPVMPPISNPGSTLTSPALKPMRERDLDQEATAALLMLNSDRRGTAPIGGRSSSSGSARGMSVRDLLSA